MAEQYMEWCVDGMFTTSLISFVLCEADAVGQTKGSGGDWLLYKPFWMMRHYLFV